MTATERKEKSRNPSWPSYFQPEEVIKRIKEIMRKKGFSIPFRFNNQPYDMDDPESLNLADGTGVWLFESVEQVESALVQGLIPETFQGIKKPLMDGKKPVVWILERVVKEELERPFLEARNRALSRYRDASDKFRGIVYSTGKNEVAGH